MAAASLLAGMTLMAGITAAAQDRASKVASAASAARKSGAHRLAEPQASEFKTNPIVQSLAKNHRSLNAEAPADIAAMLAAAKLPAAAKQHPIPALAKANLLAPPRQPEFNAFSPRALKTPRVNGLRRGDSVSQPSAMTQW
jgi:hypothetical protein